MTEPTTPPVLDDAEGDLIDDLLAQLESRDGQVQAESAKVLNSMHLEDKADIVESSTKQDAKTRYKARQVSCFSRIKFKLLCDVSPGPKSCSPC